MRKFVICLCAVYLIGSFQSTGTAAELEGLVVYFAFEEGAGKTVKDLSRAIQLYLFTLRV